MSSVEKLIMINIFCVFIVVFYLPSEWRYPLSTAIFSIAAITDWLDGWIARAYDQVTPFGAFLDPVADKLMVVAALVLLVETYNSPWFAIPAIIIIGREITISALREWMAELGKRTSVAVSAIGKIKTAMQMIAIIVLLYDNPAEPTFLTPLGYVSLYAAAVLTLWSMVLYLKAAWPTLSDAS